MVNQHNVKPLDNRKAVSSLGHHLFAMSSLNFNSPSDGFSASQPPQMRDSDQSSENYDHNAFIAQQMSYGNTHAEAKEDKKRAKNNKRKAATLAAKAEAGIAHTPPRNKKKKVKG